jgi:hypothetical protein
MRMILEHPALGVGAGNWHIVYPRIAPSDDPSVDSFGLAPTTRFPQSDWLGLASELGVLATLVAALSGLLLLGEALRALRAPLVRPDDATMLGAVTLCGVLAALLIAGVFDAVLLQATPLATSAIAVAVFSAPLARRRALSRARSLPGSLLIGAVLGVCALHAARQLAAGYLASTMDIPNGYIAAARVNPADYQVNAWLATYWIRSGSCPRSMPYIRAAQRLYPTAPQLARLERQCRLLM